MRPGSWRVCVDGTVAGKWASEMVTYVTRVMLLAVPLMVRRAIGQGRRRARRDGPGGPRADRSRVRSSTHRSSRHTYRARGPDRRTSGRRHLRLHRGGGDAPRLTHARYAREVYPLDQPARRDDRRGDPGRSDSVRSPRRVRHSKCADRHREGSVPVGQRVDQLRPSDTRRMPQDGVPRGDGQPSGRRHPHHFGECSGELAGWR